LVFAMGAMYFAMLVVGWNLHQTMHRYIILKRFYNSWMLGS
jgi:hypothetical protein